MIFTPALEERGKGIRIEGEKLQWLTESIEDPHELLDSIALESGKHQEIQARGGHRTTNHRLKKKKNLFINGREVALVGK